MKRKILIASGIFLVAALVVLVVLSLINRKSSNEFTGGSGEPEVGTLSLTGYNTPSNDSSKIALSKFVTSDQEATIRTSLEVLLYEKDPEKSYRGAVIPGTVDINYMTNIIQFKTKIQKPSVTYTIVFNPVNDKISVLDESGHVLNSTGK